METKYGDRKLKIAIGSDGSLGKVKNQLFTWEDLIKRCSRPAISSETQAEYLSLPKTDQDRLKNVGFFLGGECANGWRTKDNMVNRSLVVFDVDEGTPEMLDQLDLGVSGLSEYEFFVYSTRKHTERKPRLRIVILLDEPVALEYYVPLARILAEKLDPTLDSVDDVSFRPAQLMYWPSTSSDAPFYFTHNPGKPVRPFKLLDSWGDWRDWSKLPFSERQGRKKPTEQGKRAENPLEKPGIIGAFCRIYDVESAISKFLPDVYTPGDESGGKPRYTFVGGSTSNGAVVEDGGLFLYSFHTTDPVSERLVNAFDLVRIHKFGHLDAGQDLDEERPTALPSYKRMVEWAAEDKAVRTELARAKYDIVAMFKDYGDAGAGTDDDDDSEEIDVLGEAEPESDWLTLLDIDGHGNIKSSAYNVALILQNDPRFKGVAQFNQFTGEIVQRRNLLSHVSVVRPIHVSNRENGDRWEDRHDNAIRIILEAPNGKDKPGYGLKVSDRDLVAGVEAAAIAKSFHPVQDYLKSLTWDGRERVSSVFVDYLGAPDNAYSREIAEKMFLAAVTRAFEPGHKFDFAVILEGKQGRRKSTFIRTLAKGKWFTELHGTFSDRKRMVEIMQQYWICELPELSGFSKADVEEIKAFISDSNDTVRLAYDRRARSFPRKCVFIGSTNSSEYLRDATGGRRFWPVRVEVETIDTDRLESEIDQIWAETYVMYKRARVAQPHGFLPLHLVSRTAQEMALEKQESRRIQSIEDVIAGQVEEWLDRPIRLQDLGRGKSDFPDLSAENVWVRRSRASLAEIWVDCLGNDLADLNHGDVTSLGRMMMGLENWVFDGRQPTKFGRQRVYARKGTTPKERKLGYTVVEPPDDEIENVL